MARRPLRCLPVILGLKMQCQQLRSDHCYRVGPRGKSSAGLDFAADFEREYFRETDGPVLASNKVGPSGAEEWARPPILYE